MIITKTPLRISLLGGNTDFPKYFKKHGGAVLTTTIDKYVYCIVKERFDKEIWINYSEKEKVTTTRHIKHDLAREAMKLLNITESIEITFLSDIPSEGSGLGSSSAVVIGLLNALHTYKGENVPARQLAEEACKIEVDILKKPIGYQDQYAVAFGGTNLIVFSETIDVEPWNVNLDNLMLFYTGITRKSEGVLSKMKLDKDILDKNKELVDRALGGKRRLSTLLNEYWDLKKKLNSHVSNEMIDDLYLRALNFGADGGKIVGAGGGGFLLLIVPPQYRESLRVNMPLEELPFNVSSFGSRVVFNMQE